MTALVLGTGHAFRPAYYLMLAGIVGVIVTAKLVDPARRPLPGSDPAVSTDEEARELVASGGAHRS